MAELATGVTSAASSTPTTPAFTPAAAARSAGRCSAPCQNGSAPSTSRNAGTKIDSNATTAPATPPGNGIAAPRKAANENSGPGMTCAAA